LGYNYEKYTEAMKSGVPSMQIVQAHLLAEHYMDRIISVFLARGEKLIKNGNLSFYQKVILLQSFGKIQDRLIQALKDLNRIRNGCTHELDKAVSLSDIDRIGRNFGSIYVEHREKHLMDTKPLTC